jgi:hypothetical protein
MNEYYRDDPPIDNRQLGGTLAPFHLAIESTYYYEVHNNRPKWDRSLEQMGDWFTIVRYLRSNDIAHRGYDYPDWREYALLDMTRPTRYNLCTKLDWYDDVDLAKIEQLADTNMPLMNDDVVELLARIRRGLSLKKTLNNTLHSYIFGMLYCKELLLSSDEKIHDALLPIYNNLYSLLLVSFDLHPLIFTNNSFWMFHSTLFLFPYEVGLLDRRTFIDKRSWLMNSLILAIKGIS